MMKTEVLCTSYITENHSKHFENTVRYRQYTNIVE